MCVEGDTAGGKEMPVRFCGGNTRLNQTMICSFSEVIRLREEGREINSLSETFGPASFGSLIFKKPSLFYSPIA